MFLHPSDIKISAKNHPRLCLQFRKNCSFSQLHFLVKSVADFDEILSEFHEFCKRNAKLIRSRVKFVIFIVNCFEIKFCQKKVGTLVGMVRSDPPPSPGLTGPVGALPRGRRGDPEDPPRRAAGRRLRARA